MISRAIALFSGGFLVLNVLGELLQGGFDETVVLVDLRGGPFLLTRLTLLLAAVLLLVWAAWPAAGRVRRALTVSAVGFMGLVALANTADFYGHLARGLIDPPFPMPFSLLVFVGLLWVLRALMTPSREPDHAAPSRGRGIAVLFGSGVLFLLFPLLQMVFFGATDYRRPADAAVVLGARAYADGQPSQALADRVRTGVALWHEGLVPYLVFSGGPGDGDIHETESMRRLALSLGVPEDAILLDRQGLCTADTARNVARMAGERNWSGVLAVSHAFHLPRIKMAFRREGVPVWTVPAEETRALRSKPYLMAREVAAFWAYWVAAAL